METVLATMFPEAAPERLDGDVAKFTRLFLGSIYKRVRAPIPLHIGNRDRERAAAAGGAEPSVGTRGRGQPASSTDGAAADR